ncbi:hypothetical protein FACS1894214_1400 [Planctomycetales bacterium]|nr:hypothetical protein FACS1894214_1400 [Planctomycetales bacterium]
MRSRNYFAALTLVLLIGILLMPVFSVYAQTSSSSNDNDNNSSGSTYAGVRVSPQQVLERDAVLDYGRVSQAKLNAVRTMYTQGLSANVKVQSPLRYVSLNRLEKAITESNGVITEEMQCLAGLQRIQYVFYLPETKDIVIAGYAEGWFPGYEGAFIGLSTGRPVCELQDLIVALRSYSAGKEGASVVGCSIDPTQEGNARLQEFVKSFGRFDDGTAARRSQFAAGLKQALGMQTVRVDGIPANTHAALVMVSADYRMKRIGIGVEEPAVPLISFISKVKPGASNALYRWYFVPDYQAITMTEDKNGIELSGEGVKLVAEDEIVAATGERSVKKGKVDAASRAFANSFTKEYPKLSRKSLVFAQLRNFVDMLVAAAYIQQQDFYGKTGWTMEFFGNESKYAVQTYTAPSSVEPVVGMKERGNVFMAPIGGGVEIEPAVALKEENLKKEENGAVSALQNKTATQVLSLKAGQWWWD